MFVLVTYDIEDDKLRTRIAQVLEGFGNRVQYSVFECNLVDAEYNKLKVKLTQRLEQAKAKSKQKDAFDQGFSIRFYRLCAACHNRFEHLGEGGISVDEAFYII